MCLAKSRRSQRFSELSIYTCHMTFVRQRLTTMKEFEEAVRDAVEASLGEEYQVQIHDVVKNNDPHLTRLITLMKVVEFKIKDA